MLFPDEAKPARSNFLRWDLHSPFPTSVKRASLRPGTIPHFGWVSGRKMDLSRQPMIAGARRLDQRNFLSHCRVSGRCGGFLISPAKATLKPGLQTTAGFGKDLQKTVFLKFLKNLCSQGPNCFVQRYGASRFGRPLPLPPNSASGSRFFPLHIFPAAFRHPNDVCVSLEHGG